MDLEKNGSESFSERLFKLRLNKRMTQKELADAVGLSKNHIGRYERGLSEPSSDSLMRLADVLGVTSDYLISGSTEDAAKADFEDRELLFMFKEVEQMDQSRKNMVKEFLSAMINQEKIREMARKSG
jgi:transcriptional regulator with XRE-family HTH domain